MDESAIGFPDRDLEATLQYLLKITGSHIFLSKYHIAHDVAEHIVLVFGAEGQVFRQKHLDMLSLLSLGLLSDLYKFSLFVCHLTFLVLVEHIWRLHIVKHYVYHDMDHIRREKSL